ncbi:MAG: serine kinase [Armatimonadetes bacterium]|nr:serine kinase [Armatimonadota bacterium]
MQLIEIIEKLNLKTLTNVEERNVEGVFISDMLSDVMTNAKSGNLWLTIQTHKNTVSAANLVNLAAIVITHEKEVPQETIDLANRFYVIILGSDLSTYELVSKLVGIGLTP